MKHSLLFSFIVLLLAVSCTDQQSFKIAGTFASDDYEGKTVYLTNFNQEQIDSVKVKNKQFKFKGNIQDVSDICFVRYDERHRSGVIFPEPGNIIITFDHSLTSHIEGTPFNDAYQNFFYSIQKLADTGMQMAKAAEKEMEENKITEQDYVQKQDAFLDEFRNNIFEFVKQNIQTPVGEYSFLEYSSYLQSKQILELISMMRPKFKATESVQELEKTQLGSAATRIGNPFIDVKGKSIDGKEASLSDYAGKGKIVLIDFWASWCGPCIKSLPHLVEIYQKYKNKDFEIVAISLDDDKTAWENASKKHRVTWPQLSNLKAWSDEIAVTYGINSIPTTILLDKNGIIIEKDLNGKDLEQKLDELLK
jgi:thiol-disulfide isomerase/thioredoxin